MAARRKTSIEDEEDSLLDAIFDELSNKEITSKDIDEAIRRNLLEASAKQPHSSRTTTEHAASKESTDDGDLSWIGEMLAGPKTKSQGSAQSPSESIGRVSESTAISNPKINPETLKARVLAVATAEIAKSNSKKLLQEIGEILEDKDLGRKLDALTKQHIREQISELFSTASKSIFTSEAEFHDFVREIASEFLAPTGRAELPTEAPALWADRTTGREVTPVDFIKQYYGDFVASDLPQQHRLPRPLLRELDMPLYNAYAAWIKRHPEDDLHLPTRSELVDLELSNLDEATLRRAGRLKSTAYRRKNDL
ncbi:hypothetical protein V1T76_04460 [Roseibium sp. FZY0029]|uniref:hypothetical protein n=1 Tax=Roseibium sp. FZY0029 TaxID=3116647 RepID=UPI002EA970AE|nr:hypothetical protein [Roseibium sp. FZY0029]